MSWHSLHFFIFFFLFVKSLDFYVDFNSSKTSDDGVGSYENPYPSFYFLTNLITNQPTNLYLMSNAMISNTFYFYHCNVSIRFQKKMCKNLIIIFRSINSSSLNQYGLNFSNKSSFLLNNSSLTIENVLMLGPLIENALVIAQNFSNITFTVFFIFIVDFM